MRLLIIPFYLLLIYDITAQPHWVNYANDHLINEVVIHEDILWVGSQGGLIKIDLQTGEKETFQAWNSGLRGTGVREIEFADDGTMWLGGQNGGLFKYDGSSFEQFYQINTGDILQYILNLQLDGNGNPWFISNVNDNWLGNRKLYSFDGEKFIKHDHHFDFVNGGTSRFIDFNFINGSEMWVAQLQKIVKYNGVEITEELDASNSELRAEEKIRHIEVDQHGDLWVTTSVPHSGEYIHRILRYDGNVWHIENNNTPDHARQFFQDENGLLWFEFFHANELDTAYASYDGVAWNYWSVSDLIAIPNAVYQPGLKSVDKQGNWWLTWYSGNMHTPYLYKINESNYEAYDTEIDPIGTNYYNDVVTDCDNNIWLTGSSTVSKFDGLEWENFDGDDHGFDHGPQQIALNPITCDLWVSLYSDNPTDSPVMSYDGLDFEFHAPGSGTCFSIDVAKDGTVYAGTSGEGLGVYKNGIWTFYNENNSPLHEFVPCVKSHFDGSVWLYSYDKGVFRLFNDEWTNFNSANAPIDDYSYFFDLDLKGNIWCRYDGGLSKYDGTNWEVYSFSQLEYGINCLTEDPLGNYWLGTSEGAIYWNGFDFVTYDVGNSNIGSNYTKEIHVDPLTGDIWFVHSTGVSVFKNFYPGNHISGVTFFDQNQDGIFDTQNDVRLPNQELLLLPDSTTALTNSVGGYSFYPQAAGPYQIQLIPSSIYQPTSLTQLDTLFDQRSITNMNFGLWSDDNPPSMSIDMVGGPLVCNDQLSIWITFKNEGFFPISGDINLEFHADFIYNTSNPIASAINMDNLLWSFTDLKYQHARTYKVVLDVPGVHTLNQTYDFTATMTVGNEVESITVTDEVLCSYDPNDKVAIPLGDFRENYSLLEDPLQYVIRFQNLGNYLAKDIIVSDVIDPELDISTFKVISSSHNMTTTINKDRQVVFRFEDINLPPDEEDHFGSQGYIKYQITPRSGIVDGTIIKNSASIYFDFNPPIITNTTKNILVETLDVGDYNLQASNEASVYPNPSNGELWIKWSKTSLISDWNIEVYDVAGQLLYNKSFKGQASGFTLPQKGIYIIKIQKGDYIQIEKVIIS